MSTILMQGLADSISKYPKTNDEIIKYGTAGFRTLLVYLYYK